MALAMMVKTRLWLGGEVSEQRDMTLIRRLIERVRRCAAPRPLLFCTDGLCSYMRAIRETFRDPVQTGAHGRPQLRPWRNVCITQVVKRYAQRRIMDVERRIVDGTPMRVETLRRRTHGEGVINTAYNFCPPHASLAHVGGRTTPAMAAGITDHCWTVRELLSFHVPLPRWTPPARRGRRSQALQRLIAW